MLSIAYSNEIKSFNINVSEKIKDANFSNFISTSLNLNNFETTKNDFLHVIFIEEILQYQILIFPQHNKIPIFQIFEQLYFTKTDLITFDLYITNTFFCLYKNRKIYYYQNLESKIINEELLDYLSKKFNQEINNYKFFTELNLKELEVKYLKQNNKNSIKNFNQKNNFSFKLYLIYLIIIFSIIFIFKEKNQIEENFKTENNFNDLKNEYLFNYFYLDFDNLNNLLRKYNLNLKLLDYKDNKIKLIFTSNSKPNIYAFLEDIKNRLISQQIIFIENENIFESIIYVK